MLTPKQPNTQQITYWNEIAGPKWVGLGDAMDTRFAAINTLLLAKAAAQPGEAVLDIGAGTGISALPLADAVTPTGQVTGIDISLPMLDVAKSRALGHPNLSYLQADAQTHDFGGQKFNLLASRFGVMFFEDPIAAFTNLRRALAPGGRLCFICWAPLADNPHWQVPFEIVTAAIGAPAPKLPHTPGPLAFSDRGYLMTILQTSGFQHANITPHPVPIIGDTLESEAAIACLVGPAGALLDEKNADESTRARLRAAIATALRQFETPDGPRLPATVFVVTAS